MKRKDTALLVGGTLTGMGVVMNVLALGFIKENFTRRAPKIKPGKIESIDEMHIDYLRRKNSKWLKMQKKDSIVIRSHDGLKLKGEYFHNSETDREKDEPVDIVLFIHGYGGTGYKDMLIFTDYYRKKGYDMMLIDQRSHGKSEGSAITFGALEKEDISRWVNYLVKKFNGNCRIILHGWSMGAATAYLAAANGLPKQVKGIVYDCGYSVAETQFLHVAKQIAILPTAMLWYIIQFMKPWCKFLCGFSMSDSSPLLVSHKMHLPIFFVHGDKDSCVPVSMGKIMYEATYESAYRDLLIVPDADHTYSYIHGKSEYELGLDKLLNACMD